MISAAALVLAMTAPPQPVIRVEKHTTYSNIKMEGAEYLWGVKPGVDSEAFTKLADAAQEDDQPRVFLVRAADLRGAVGATCDVFTGKAKPDAVVSAEGADDAEVWVAAYLFNGPGTAVAKVRGVEVDGDVIRVLTGKESLFGVTADSKPYLVWANLGNLPAGSYTLQLIYGETPLKAKAVATRTVTVGRKK